MTHTLDTLSFPLNGTRLMEASAGTGKTYTIAALYLRLVLGHGNSNGFGRPLSPPEILVVTFTNAATEELRHRIRGTLDLDINSPVVVAHQTGQRQLIGESIDMWAKTDPLNDSPDPERLAYARRFANPFALLREAHGTCPQVRF